MISTASALAEYLGAGLDGDPSVRIEGIASPERARSDDLIYLGSPRHQDRVNRSMARCVIARPEVSIAGKTVLHVSDPKLAFAKAAAWLLREASSPGFVHPTAIVSPSAQLGAAVRVGPYVVIEDDVTIGNSAVIEAFCYLGPGACVGKFCRLHPRVTLYGGVRIGEGVEVHAGAVLGADGFGYVYGEGRHWKFPQVGEVEIGDEVEIGANTTIDRGALETTKIGNGVKVDNLVQIAHNVQIDAHSIVAAQSGISGSASLGKNVIVGGQVGIADHCRVEDGAVIGAQAGVPSGKTIRRGQTVWGTPARPLEKFKRQYAWFARLPELAERVLKLESSSSLRR